MSGALDRFLDAARALGLQPETRRFPQGTKTAEDAARAIGCDVGQIVKSLVFMADDRPVLALTSGSNRVDERKLAALAGAGIVRRASPEEAREATGFTVGGTPPFCSTLVRPDRHPTVFLDGTLLMFDELWAAAGTPDAVFPITPSDLATASGATVASFAE